MSLGLSVRSGPERSELPMHAISCPPSDPRSAMRRRVLSIGLPSAGEAVLSGLTALFDVAMVGKLGSAAVASVGLTNQPRFICMAFIQSLNVGAVALIARRIGEENPDEANRTFRRCLFLSLLLSLTVCSLSFAFAEPFLHLAGCTEETIGASLRYFRFLLPGLLLQLLTMTAHSGLRCTGHSRVVLETNLAANLVNIVLNYLLIGGHFGFPALGVTGAAVATSIGYLVSFCLTLRFLLRPDSMLSLQGGKSWLPNRNLLLHLRNVVLGAFAEHVCLRTGFFVYALMVARLGTVAFATHQICMNLANVILAAYDGLAAAPAVLVGHGLGAGEPQDSRLAVRVSTEIALCSAAVIALLLVLLRVPVMRIFSSEEPVVSVGSRLLILLAAACFGASLLTVYGGALRGAGDTRFVAAVSLLTTTLMRPLVSWFLCFLLGWGLYGPWTALFLDLTLRAGLNISRFRKGIWETIRL